MYIDPISDLLVRLKSSVKSKKETVIVNSSKLIESILKILKIEGYIQDFNIKKIENNKKQTLVFLKYKNNISSISGLRQISKPGLRTYVEAARIPKVINGLGIAIISTSQGMMTDKMARSKNVGGEVIAYIW